MSVIWKKINKSKLIILCAFAGFIFIIDQGSKLIVLAHMDLGQTIPVLPDLFHLTLVKNPGAAFGILPYQTAFFLVATTVAVILLIFFSLYLSGKGYGLNVALALLTGGALGNLADRIRTGYVIDFLDFRIWPVFNLADVAIVIGLIVFAISIRHMKQ